MPSVYLSHSVSPWELAQVSVLARETERHGLQTFIPDRNWEPSAGLPPHLKGTLQQADVILVFATLNGGYSDWVNQELREASNRPLVALIEQGIRLSAVDNRNVAQFSWSEDIAPAIQRVIARLQALDLQKQTSNLLAGLIIGGLVLLLLRGLGGKGDQG